MCLLSFGFCKETTWSTVSGLGGSTGNLPTSAHARRMEVGSERSEGVFRVTVFSVSGLSICFLSLSFVYCAGAVLVSYWDKRSHFALVVTCRHLPTLPRSYLSTRSCDGREVSQPSHKGCCLTERRRTARKSRKWGESNGVCVSNSCNGVRLCTCCSGCPRAQTSQVQQHLDLGSVCKMQC